jgi:hypothetical protein
MLKKNRDVLFVFVLLAFAYGYFYQDPFWNGNSRLDLTMAIVRDRRLRIDAFHANESEGLKTGDKAFYNGHYYTDKPIGSSLVAAVFYFPVYWATHPFKIGLNIFQVKQYLTFFSLGIPSALAGSLIYLVCLLISGSRFRSYLVTLAVALGTMSFPFSVVYFGHQLAAAFLFAGFCLIFLLRAGLEPVRPWYLALIGFLLGMAFIIDLTTAVILLPLGLYFLYVLRGRKMLEQPRAYAFPALGAALPVALMLGYNFAIFHNPFASSYHYEVDPYFRTMMAQGLMGIGLPRLDVLFYETLHPAQGLFWQSPVLLLVFAGFFFILRSKVYRAEGLVALIAFAGYLLLNAGYFLWWGGGSFAPRQMVPMLPFLCLPLIVLPKRWFPALAALAVISIGQMVIVAASTYNVLEIHYRQIPSVGFFAFSAIYSVCLKLLTDGHFAWNLGKVVGLSGWFSLLPLAAVLVGSTVMMARWRENVIK